MTGRFPAVEADAAGWATVLATGASGFVGGSLVCRLLSSGARVRVLARSPVQAKRLAAAGAQAVIGDITDRTVVRAAMDGAQLVYHLAGRLLVPGVPAAEYQRTHVGGTKLLLACCEEAPS